jgi:MFS family permease
MVIVGRRGRERRAAVDQARPALLQESLQWVITAYAILFGGALLLGGRLADLLGRGGCSWPAWRCSRSARCFRARLVGGALIVTGALQGSAARCSPGGALDRRHHLPRGRDRNIALGVWGAAPAAAAPSACCSAAS